MRQGTVARQSEILNFYFWFLNGNRGWEGVGLPSPLLIGFDGEREDAFEGQHQQGHGKVPEIGIGFGRRMPLDGGDSPDSDESVSGENQPRQNRLKNVHYLPHDSINQSIITEANPPHLNLLRFLLSSTEISWISDLIHDASHWLVDEATEHHVDRGLCSDLSLFRRFRRFRRTFASSPDRNWRRCAAAVSQPIKESRLLLVSSVLVLIVAVYY